MMPDSRYTFKRRIAMVVLCISSVVLLILVGLLVVNYVNPGQQTAGHPNKQGKGSPTAQNSPAAQISPTLQPNAPPSPLLFGTNLGLFNDHDQFINSSQTRNLMQQIHVRIVRMPTRPNLPLAVEQQAAQAIKSIGAIPLLALVGGQRPDALAIDTQMIQMMNNVFGNSLVYYEFGNEDDLNGVLITDYTAKWSSLVPQLKRLARNGQFIGPVSYQYSHDNLTAFLQGAHPAPDLISWHEYTRSYKDPAQDCLNSIDHWTNHITDARSVMQSTLGKMLPIMITEWNYASDQSTQSNGQPIPDGKYDNSQFMTQWTTRAIETLAQNQVFASMQYSATDTSLPLITYHVTLTVQGTTFGALYQKLIR